MGQNKCSPFQYSLGGSAHPHDKDSKYMDELPVIANTNLGERAVAQCRAHTLHVEN